MKLPVIDQALGVAESTGQGKAKAIRQLLRIHQFDHRWTLPSRWEKNPLIWILQDANGFMIDIRQQPVAMQRAAFEQGLIGMSQPIARRPPCKNLAPPGVSPARQGLRLKDFDYWVAAPGAR